MVRAFWFTVAVLLISATRTFPQVPTEPLAVKVSLCQLAESPEVFNGKMVQVRASAMGRVLKDLWIDDFEQKPACSAWIGVIVVLPEQLKPQPNFDVVRDASFGQFRDKIRDMNVQATFVGRFEAVYTWKEHKRIWVTSAQNQKGFGKKARYGGRIVLHRVSDVAAHYVPGR